MLRSPPTSSTVFVGTDPRKTPHAQISWGAGWERLEIILKDSTQPGFAAREIVEHLHRAPRGVLTRFLEISAGEKWGLDWEVAAWKIIQTEDSPVDPCKQSESRSFGSGSFIHHMGGPDAFKPRSDTEESRRIERGPAYPLNCGCDLVRDGPRPGPRTTRVRPRHDNDWDRSVFPDSNKPEPAGILREVEPEPEPEPEPELCPKDWEFRRRKTRGEPGGNCSKEKAAPEKGAAAEPVGAEKVWKRVAAHAAKHGSHPDFDPTTVRARNKLDNYIMSVCGNPLSAKVLEGVRHRLRP